MSSTYSVFFTKEFTCLPSLLDKYLGKYYNNAVGNAVTWFFFIWLFVHYLFDKFATAILRQMKYPEYLRLRIASTLWYFGFLAGSFLYCFATLSRNRIEVKTFHEKIFLRDTDVIPGQFVLGFWFLSTFYAQSAVWEATKNNFLFVSLEFFFLTLLSALTYINGYVELFFVLIYLNNLTLCIFELSRTFSFQLYNRNLMTLISNVYFIFHVGLSLVVYTFVYPLFIIVPFAKQIAVNFSVQFVLLNTLLWIWICLNFYNSVIVKLIHHYVWHKTDDHVSCRKSYIQCAIFPPRTDTAFTLKVLKKEIDDINATIKQQKKKPVVALKQFLKCAVSFRRKVKDYRRRVSELEEFNKGEIIVKSILNEIINDVVPDDSDNDDSSEFSESDKNIDDCYCCNNLTSEDSSESSDID